MKWGQFVANHLRVFENLINQLGVIEMSLNDEMHALLVLSSMSDSWETLMVSFSNSAPNSKLTMAIVKDPLFYEEARRTDAGTDQAHALVVENRGRMLVVVTEMQGRGIGAKVEDPRVKPVARANAEVEELVVAQKQVVVIIVAKKVISKGIAEYSYGSKETETTNKKLRKIQQLSSLKTR